MHHLRGLSDDALSVCKVEPVVLGDVPSAASFASLISGGHMSDSMSAFVAEIATAVVLSSLFALLTRTLLE